MLIPKLLIECGTPLWSIDNGKDAADVVGDVIRVFSALRSKVLELSWLRLVN